MNYFNFYPGDYLRDTTRLTMAQNGAFLSLLCAYYSEAAPLPANDTAIFLICKAATKAEQRDALLVADKYFPIGDDGLRHNARADFEIEKAKPRIESARQNGSKGGRPRKPSGLSERNPVGYQRETQEKPNGLSEKPIRLFVGSFSETHAGVGVGARASQARGELPYGAAVGDKP